MLPAELLRRLREIRELALVARTPRQHRRVINEIEAVLRALEMGGLRPEESSGTHRNDA